MKKTVLIFILVFFLLLNHSFAWYNLENWSQKLVEKYNFSTLNLEKEITRKEFVETLSKWYIDYKKDRWVIVDYSNYEILDNSKIFKDVDLKSDFWKKLNYFTHLWGFSKREFFNPNGVLIQRDFFTVMKQLKIMFGLQNCKYHKICEKEVSDKTIFLKWTYLKYVSKIMDKNLRKYYSSPKDYLQAGYKPYLNTNYYFPLKGQTLNWCYAFSVRNILKYKNGIWVYIPKIEEAISKKWSDLWTYNLMSKHDNYVHVEKNSYYNIDTLISSLQVWEPVIISYMLKYYSYKDKIYKKVPHLVAAYSFDNNWIWVSETVTNRRKIIPWEEVFTKYWWVKLNRIFKVYYKEKSTWTEEERKKEEKNNYLVWEY